MESQIVLCRNRLSRRHGSRRALLLATTALSSSLMIGQVLAQNLPTGGSVAAGSVSIAAPSATQLNITQTSQSAVVNWQGFSIGQGSAVNIQQPNSNSALLNRVTGDAPSTIAGSLTANGQVYLVNPNGIAITKSGVVNVDGGFVASTLGILDADFQSGKRSFTGNGASAGVSNAGTITVGRGGYAALIGGTVANSGSILVPFGKVGLGSGERATLDFSGDGFLQVALPTAAPDTGALIKHSGRIKADGGSVIISAATAREAARNAVNLSGLVQARSIGGRSGAIQIGGGAGGSVKITGRLNAKSRQKAGGSITVTGQNIKLKGATVDASGKTGGGTVNIGGGRQGKGPLQRADSVTIDKNTTIRADARATGNGGNVVVWSDIATHFHGMIMARGGALGGNGGEAEVSGKAKLDYTGFTDLSAANGRFGTLLLDPFNVTISTGTNNTGGSFVANTDDSIINASTLQTALGAANVTVTTGTGGSQAGNITVAAPLTWSAPTTLTLDAAGAIAINAPISITGAGGLALTAKAVDGITTTGLTFGTDASVTYGPIDKGGTFSLNGRAYMLVYSMAQLDAIDGVNAVDGAGLTAYGAGLSGFYALADNLTASGTTYTRALIGLSSATPFRGTLDGLGHTITGLTINAPAADDVGLIGHKVRGSVSNIGLVGGSIIGRDHVGSLIGFNDSGVVQTSFNTGTVSGNQRVGGLVGVSYVAAVQSSYATGAVTGAGKTGGLVGEANFGSRLRNTYATGAVTSTGDDTGGLIGNNSGGTLDRSYATGKVSGAVNTGGLAGYNNQIIQNSYATGIVTGTDNTGGLLGRNEGTVDRSHATGVTTGNETTGGLVGYNNLIVQNSYATGAVNGDSRTGGLIGQNNFGNVSVLNSYATGAVTGTGANTGGLIGDHSRGTVDGSYATGAVLGSEKVGGLVGYSTQMIQNSHATGNVTGTDGTGGLIGRNEGTVDGSYATGVTTGEATTGGLVGYALGTAIVRSSYATGAVFGFDNTGGLIGATNFGSPTVLNSYATGAVTGTGYNTGGLIGSASGGSIDGSHATGAVFGFENTGGLVGYSNQTIQNSYATGAVLGSDSTGGLIGTNEGTVDGSYATGVTTGNATTGGLVGFGREDAIVRSSYATGAVFGSDNTGGLIGATAFGNPTVLNSYATGAVTGTGYNTGGLIGNASGGSIDSSHATGAVFGSDHTGGLAGYSNQTIRNSYATGAVTGNYATGGLIGYNQNTIDGSYASGSVTGDYASGGLVGLNESGSIQNSYAMGAVLGNDVVGGLVGVNVSGGTVQTSYATGAVTGGGPVGGLIGYNEGGVTTSYWDTSTSGQADGIGAGDPEGVTGLTTAQLQGTGPVPLGAAFSGGAAGGTAGLYPFLLSMFPDGVTAISGFAYQDAGITLAASGASGAVQVGLTVGGVAQGQATTGANGYYYFAVPSALIADSGTVVLATTAANVATGTQDGAAIISAKDSIAGLDIFGGSSHLLTTALTYSTSGYGSVLESASTPAFVAALPTTIMATGASFTMDQPLTVSGSLAVRTTATDAGLIVGAPITLTGANTLTLTAAGALTIDAPISVTGAGAVVLAAAAQSGITTTGLTFGNGASIDYGATNKGGSFSLNGHSYTLVYSMAQLDAIDGRNAVDGMALTVYGTGVTGNYVLARNLVADTRYTRAVVGEVANAYSGRLDGLGHTVTGLTIDAPTRNHVGLIGYLAGGSVSNIGVVGGSVTGHSNVGAVVGNISGGGSVLQTSFATATVASAGSGNSTGGLAGVNNGLVQSSYASGAVTGGYYVGGLVGYNFQTIQSSYATGPVTGTVNTGGLVGLSSGTIADSYSTGAVRGGDQVGGLLGTNSPGGNVRTSYSTGFVSGATNVGGLIGSNFSTVASSYWNFETSGQSVGMGSDSRSQSANVTGRTTAQLRAGTLPAGFGAAWNIGAGLYPYLTWQFAAGTTPQAVSGTAYKADGTALAGALVAGTVNGTAFASGNVSTGANGYYYAVMPQGSIAAGNNVFTYVAANVVKANAFLQGATGSVQNLDLHGDMLTVTTGATTLSSVAAGLASAVGATVTTDLNFTTPGGVLTSKAATGVSIAASGDFGVDRALIAANSVLINAAGSLTIASTGTVTSSGGDATLVAGTTFVNASGADALSAASGRWLVYSGDPADDTRGGLVYDFKQYAATFGVTAVAQATGNGVFYTAAPVAGLTAPFSKEYDGDNGAALSSSTTGIDGDVLILNASSAVFDNANAGTEKTVTVTGLTVASASNGGAAVYGYMLGSTTASGIGAITQRAITVTADAQSRVYGDANPDLSYTIGGSGLVDGDSLSGSLATDATSATGVGSYAITQGSLANSNYALTYVAANLAITPRPITVTADAQSRVYGDANPDLSYSIGGSGLVHGDSLSGSLTTDATSATGVGSYAIAQGSLANSNYALTYVAADLAITPRAITVTADAQSRIYGQANPELTYRMTGNLVNQDGFTGRLATTATTASAAGSYGIEQSTLTAGGNYALTYRAANLTVTAPPTDLAPAASTVSNMVEYSGTVSPIDFPSAPTPACESAPAACSTSLFYKDKRFGQ